MKNFNYVSRYEKSHYSVLQLDIIMFTNYFPYFIESTVVSKTFNAHRET